jgi:hypothetical protein
MLERKQVPLKRRETDKNHEITTPKTALCYDTIYVFFQNWVYWYRFIIIIII